MRHLIGAGTPKEAVARGIALILLVSSTDDTILLGIALFAGSQTAFIAVIAAIDPFKP